MPSTPSHDGPLPESCDIAIVGGGILGLATAREMLRRRPKAAICVIEREAEIASHQTGHNSGVIHAGIYYEPGSLKARLCVEGAASIYEYCDEHAIPYRRCGKVIVACESSELPGLVELHRRGLANGVEGLRMLETEQISEIEPHVRGVAALHSPNTGIVDFKVLAGALANEVIEAGGSILRGCEVSSAQVGSRAITLAHSQGAIQAGHALYCAGAWSDRLAVACGADPDPRIVPFRGAYLRLKRSREHLVRSLVYPVPDPSLPFLGVHLTSHMSGEVLVGPTALLALSRDVNRRGGPLSQDFIQTLSWPGSWRMFRRFWRSGLEELQHRVSTRSLLKAAARYVPELELSDVEPAFSGVRAQALYRDGRLVDDFVFSATDRALHVRNAPSPAATSSLATAKHIADEAQSAFSLSP